MCLFSVSFSKLASRADLELFLDSFRTNFKQDIIKVNALPILAFNLRKNQVNANSKFCKVLFQPLICNHQIVSGLDMLQMRVDTFL